MHKTIKTTEEKPAGNRHAEETSRVEAPALPKKVLNDESGYDCEGSASKSSLSTFIEKLTWEEYALAGIIIFFIIFYGIYIAGYTQLPSPVYGGDLYRDRGFVQSIVAGSPFWEDAFYLHEFQYYGYIMPLMEAGIVMMTGIPIDRVVLSFPLLILIAAVWFWYLLGWELFQSKKWGFLTAVAFLVLDFTICPFFGAMSNTLFLPAFLYFWFRYENKEKTYLSVLAGLFLGIICLVYPA
ncbi:hypothetical protein JW711_05780, partial [Candidatus Woesearchaeota archaeon]|nr:hypothetical protein [Candidatus Woesearchaeota archaeon]